MNWTERISQAHFREAHTGLASNKEKQRVQKTSQALSWAEIEAAEVERENRERMRKFDPWPVFFKREWNRNWPFLVGFAITGTIITKMSLGLTEEDAKNSPFVQRHKK